MVFEDPHAISTFDRTIDGEERWQTIGLAGGVVLVLVAHTWTEERGEQVVRIISARKATPRERGSHEQNL